MKNRFLKNNFFKILLIISYIFILSILSFIILGSINRSGYLSKFQLVSSENGEYIYNSKIEYYSKIFRHSDIYGVYLDLGKIIKENNFIKDIKMNDGGSPFGTLITDKTIDTEKIDNINYKLRLKTPFWIILIISLLYILFYYKFISAAINTMLILKISKIVSISIIAILILLVILGKSLNHKVNLEDLQLITESNLGYVYKAKVLIPNRGIFSPNLVIWKYPNKLNYDKNINYIKSGYNLEINRQPDWYNIQIGALIWTNEDGSFTVSNSTSWNGYQYDILPSKEEIYKISIEAKKIFSHNNDAIKYHLDEANKMIPIPGTDQLSEQYEIYISQITIKSNKNNTHPHFDLYFPEGVFNIKTIKIEQISENLYLKNNDSIIFTSSIKIDDINNINGIYYRLDINTKFLIITLMILIYFNILLHISKLDNILVEKKQFTKNIIISAVSIIIIGIITASMEIKDRVGYLSDFNLISSQNGIYTYDFRLKPYNRIFNNINIFNVYFDIEKIISNNNFISEIKIDKSGSYCGKLITTKTINLDKIDNIKFNLKIKDITYLYIFIIYLFSIFLFYGILIAKENKLILISASLLMIIQIFIYLSLYNYFRVI